MIFQKESIEAILAGRKTMTRRLVKEGEYLKTGEFAYNGWYDYEKNNENELIRVVKNKRVKWQVGKKYAVCSGRGKPQVWYCPKCLSYSNEKRKEICEFGFRHFRFPLFVEVTGIRKEKLLDIHNDKEGFKKEGFNSLEEFFLTFDKINANYFKKSNTNNPDVWVISFKVV